MQGGGEQYFSSRITHSLKSLSENSTVKIVNLRKIESEKWVSDCCLLPTQKKTNKQKQNWTVSHFCIKTQQLNYHIFACSVMG